MPRIRDLPIEDVATRRRIPQVTVLCVIRLLFVDSDTAVLIIPILAIVLCILAALTGKFDHLVLVTVSTSLPLLHRLIDPL